jgi:hypothetical protein
VQHRALPKQRIKTRLACFYAPPAMRKTEVTSSYKAVKHHRKMEACFAKLRNRANGKVPQKPHCAPLRIPFFNGADAVLNVPLFAL